LVARASLSYSRCPKCGHRPLPADPSLPAACPTCGVILAKVATARRGVATARGRDQTDDGERSGLGAWLLHVPERVDVLRWWLRALLLVAFAVWGLALISLDYRSGEMGASFLHGPLLLFHEAGHLLFRPFGEWMTILGGTLGQLLMPAIVIVAFLWKNRDPFGAALGLWLLGVSLLDVAPYMFDALDPQLMLLSGATGEQGGHDWIYLFSAMGLLQRAPLIGSSTHKLGALVLLLSLAWAAWVLVLQRRRIAGELLHEG
jgi:ribosomal protein S27E